MKFLHTSDLHIGKSVCGFSMLEEQQAALAQMVSIVQKEQVDMVFLCGDLYDRAMPPAAAVTVMDQFLTELTELGVIVCAIAGNHDSGERIGFANRILEHRGVYLEGVLDKEIRYVDWKENGESTVRVHLLPYAKPAQVRAVFGGQASTYEESMQELMRHVSYLEDGKNILLTHQFVVDHGVLPELSDSETRTSVGGADQVEAANFKNFDYVALGHIHGPQQIGSGPVYYSGSPVKYSFSEVHHRKSVILGEWDTEGALEVRRIPLTPIHDMRKIRGKLADLIADDVVEAADDQDYLLAILTNQEELVDPMGTLRSVYPNIMQLQIERTCRQTEIESGHPEIWKELSPEALFERFYEYVTDDGMTDEQRSLMQAVIERAKEVEI